MLQKLMGSRGRAAILTILFTPEQKCVHLRELARLAQISAPVLQRELNQLVALELVHSQKDGNRVNYKANPQSPIYSLLCELVLRTDGPIGILKAAFADSSAEMVFIFGSVASGTATLNSDIDLFVIGDCGLRDVTRRIHTISDKITQEINPYVISRGDFQSRIQKHDHFLTEIYNTKKIFLKGDNNVFAQWAMKSME